MMDREHPPRHDTYGWEPADWEYWADLAERRPVDQLKDAIAVFEADLSRIEYGSTGAFYEWSDEEILAYLRRVFARRWPRAVNVSDQVEAPDGLGASQVD